MTPWGSLTNLVSFDNTNGSDPRAGVVVGADGSFYGTAYSGGAGSLGTVFKVTPQAAFSQLFSFAFTNGGYPVAGLELGEDGGLYGTAAIGGSNSAGTVFRCDTNGTMTTLYSFGFNGTNGDSPYAGLVQASDGSFYGSTYEGGTNGCGTLFRLTTNGTLTTVHLFTGANDGANPYAGLILASDGAFYGTTSAGGASGLGTIFTLTTNGAFSTILSFGNTNGANPQAALIQSADGSFYGTTAHGGAYTNQFGVGYGTVFKLTTNGTLTTLVSFNGTNGATPQAAMLMGSDGSLYGTTANGGVEGSGTVFRLDIGTPPQPTFTSVLQANSTLTLAWRALIGYRYQIQYQTNLGQSTWMDLDTAVVTTNTTATISDGLSSVVPRFYRAVLVR
jgi:uncharacterized repeat protein (TIGR03803 family)